MLERICNACLAIQPALVDSPMDRNCQDALVGQRRINNIVSLGIDKLVTLSLAAIACAASFHHLNLGGG